MYTLASRNTYTSWPRRVTLHFGEYFVVWFVLHSFKDSFVINAAENAPKTTSALLKIVDNFTNSVSTAKYQAGK